MGKYLSLFVFATLIGIQACGVNVNLSPEISDTLQDVKNGVKTSSQAIQKIGNAVQGAGQTLGLVNSPIDLASTKIVDEFHVSLETTGSGQVLLRPEGGGDGFPIDFKKLQMTTSVGTLDLVKDYSTTNNLHWIFQDAEHQYVEVYLEPSPDNHSIVGLMSIYGK